MAQHCFASISDTGLHCAYCITRDVIEEGIKMAQTYCKKHKKPCIELNYYCSSFIGYKPDWRMTDEEEKEMIEDQIRETKKLTMANLAIRGHATRGREIIELLEMLGGKNKIYSDGLKWFNGTNVDSYYTIEEDNHIHMRLDSRKGDYIKFTLEEFLEKFPYKVGDKVLVKGYESPVDILEMTWNGSEIEYRINIEDAWLTADELQPYKEETMEGVYYDGEINCYHQDFGDKVRIRLGGNFEIKVEDGKTYVVRKKPQYPKTYEECLEILGYNVSHTIPMNHGHKGLLMMRLQRLLILRDAYWKIAGDWRPDWNNDSQFKYIIACRRGNINKDTYTAKNCILAFPTEEMRDAFLENFKDLIEECKELL